MCVCAGGVGGGGGHIRGVSVGKGGPYIGDHCICIYIYINIYIYIYIYICI